ncbi:MAG: hypothetical protein NVS9B15_02890 [Acidobacteriaceae bacterium]
MASFRWDNFPPAFLFTPTSLAMLQAARYGQPDNPSKRARSASSDDPGNGGLGKDTTTCTWAEKSTGR